MGAFDKIRTIIRAGAVFLCLMGGLFALPQAWAADPAPGTHILNTAAVSFNDNNGKPMPQRTASADTVIGTASLSLVVTGFPEPVRAGNPISYTLTVTNTGVLPLTGVKLTDPIPGKTTFVSADSGGLLSLGVMSWDLGVLPVAASVTLHFVANTDLAAAGSTITDKATVTSNEVPQQTASAVNGVLARAPINVQFCDSSWHKVHCYNIGDTIYIQVIDKNRDTDPTKAGTVVVTVQSFIGAKNQTINDSVTLTLSETGPGTGLFWGSVASNGGPANPCDGTLSLDADSTLMVTYTDPVGATTSVVDTALVDPYGTVFNSATGLLVDGAVVTLVDVSTGKPAVLPQPPAVPAPQQNPVITEADGKFRFEYVSPGNYRLEVSPSTSYVFPSSVPSADLPKVYNIVPGSYGKEFTVTAGMHPLNIDMPVDPSASDLNVSKTADKNAASVGDIVRYTITVQNTGKANATSLTVTDDMPQGLKYLKGSTTINGKKASDPAVSGANELTFTVGDLPAGESATLSYSVSVGPDSPNGTVVNVAFATGFTSTGVMVSNRAQCRLICSGGVFTTKGLIIGKVFRDKNHNKVQDNGEEGLPGIVIYMEDGTRVITGTDGKYSIFGVTPGTHVLKVDETSLPKGAALEELSNRFMGDAATQFVDMPAGGLFKADFAVEGSAGSVKTDFKASGVSESVKDMMMETPVERPLEERIREMSPTLEILSPKDGSTAYIAHVNVTVKAPLDAVLSLYVNGEEVNGHLGKTIKDPVSKTTVYEFVDVHVTPGEDNIIRAETKDASGRATGSKEVALHASGRPAKIVIAPEKLQAPADGRTVTEFTIRILDGRGNLVGYPGTVTIEASKGEILDKDMDASEPGTQLEPSDGEVRAHLKSPWESGNEKITVSCNGVTETAPIFFSPHLRDMLAVGAGEVVVGYGSTRNGSDRTFINDNWLDKDIFFGGRGAFFAKGDVGWGVLLTAAFDSEKKREDVGLFKDKINNVESEELYPILGDDSKVGYEALSSDKLYVRAEKDRSYVMYGDYQTKLSEGGLAAFTRTFNGLVTDVDTRYFKTRAFESHTDTTQVVDAIQGKGIAGYYFLSEPPVVDGSELVVIETRDWRQPTRVISRTQMARWTDYTIDYGMGSILFKEPVPSHDENLNLVYIIVSYENSGTAKHYVYGGRAAVDPFPWLETGVTGVVEENDVSDFRLLGADTTARLPFKTTLRGEWAQTDSILTLDNVFTPKLGSAWSLKLESNPLTNLKVSGYFYKVGEFFNNPSAVNYQRGKESYGMDLAYKAAGDINVVGKFFVEDDGLNNMHNDFASAGIEKTFLKIFKAGLDIQYQESNQKFVPADIPTTRFPFDNSEETPSKLTALRLFLEAKPWRNLTLNVQHTQDVLRNRDNITQAGIEYQFTQSTRFYVREQYMTLEERSQTRTVAGVESTVYKDTVAFSEYRLTGGADGSRNQQSIGLRNKFSLGYGITGNVTIEDLRTLTGQQKQAEPDAFASSLGLAYVVKDDLKASSRFEYRHTTSETSYLAEFGCAYKLNRDFFLIAKERYFDDQNASSGGHILNRASTGVAYRPAWTDILNALTKFEYKFEKSPLDAGNAANSCIFSADGTLQPSGRLQVTGKYALKYTTAGSLAVYTDLVSVKAYFDLTDRIDIGATARMLTDHHSGSSLYGGAAEFGYRVIKNVWLSAGYSFDKFDSDLTQEDFWGQGPYVKLRVKMDEKSLKKLP